MLTYSFENRGADSLYEFLYKQIKQDILSGALKSGEKLPSKRALAKNLNVSTITVENSYNQLMAEGYLYSIPKSGFYVSDISSQGPLRQYAPKEKAKKRHLRHTGQILATTLLLQKPFLFPFGVSLIV